jgi:hypothetical protein
MHAFWESLSPGVKNIDVLIWGYEVRSSILKASTPTEETTLYLGLVGMNASLISQMPAPASLLICPVSWPNSLIKRKFWAVCVLIYSMTHSQMYNVYAVE